MSIEILEREPLSTQLHQSEGGLFYVIFTKAYELLNSSTRSRFPSWNSLNAQQNPLELRIFVSNKVFDDFEELCVELDDMPGSDRRRGSLATEITVSYVLWSPFNDTSKYCTIVFRSYRISTSTRLILYTDIWQHRNVL